MSNQNKLVSVVVPCFNDGEYLKEAINSVLNSTYKNVEIIIVNDGSVDNTEQIGLQLEKEFENIKYWLQDNSGPAVARNKGIELAMGEYILPLDADDKISNFYIHEAVEILENNKNTKVVYSEAEFFGNKKGKWELPRYSPDLLARENMIFCSALCRKKDIVSCGGYSEEMTWGWEDWEFWISMLKDGGEVYKIPKICFYYRIKDNSRRKGTNKIAKKKTIIFINNKHKEFIHSKLNGPLRYNRTQSKLINSIWKYFH